MATLIVVLAAGLLLGGLVLLLAGLNALGQRRLDRARSSRPYQLAAGVRVLAGSPADLATRKREGQPPQ